MLRVASFGVYLYYSALYHGIVPKSAYLPCPPVSSLERAPAVWRPRETEVYRVQ